MNSKDKLLQNIRHALNEGIITKADIDAVVGDTHNDQTAITSKVRAKRSTPISPVDMLFYIAGVIIFATIMSIIAEFWSDDTFFFRFFMTIILGVTLWSISLYLIKRLKQSDILKGVTNSLIFTGSLLLVTGVVMTMNEIFKINMTIYSEAYTLLTIMLFILTVIHLVFDRYAQRNIVALTSVLLGSLTALSFMFTIMQAIKAPIGLWLTAVLSACVLLMYAARVFTKINPQRDNISKEFDVPAVWFGLGTMYIASFIDNGVLWLTILIASIIGVFYVSIVTRDKRLLWLGAAFLVLAILTITFRYFSEYGTTASLIIATFGVLGVAAGASYINKKYL